MDSPQLSVFETPEIVSVSGRLYYEAPNSDGNAIRHETTGTVFYKTTVDETIAYRDLTHSVELMEQLKCGVVGTETDIFYKALVRRGRSGDFHYYPLPLIYASKEERSIAACELGRRPPPERWVARRRRFVNEVLKLTS